MSAMSDYLESKLIDHIFRDDAYTEPTTIAIALCGANPTDAGTTLGSVEMGTVNGTTATGYARVEVARGTTNWTASVAGSGVGTGSTKNSGTIAFATATANWVNNGGTEAAVTHAAVMDHATYGSANMLFYGTLSVGKTVNTGDVFQFSPNNFTIQLDG